jgi:hypothetical protein
MRIILSNFNSLIDNCSNRYSKILSEVVRGELPPSIDLGADPKDIGTHSTRKGAASYVSGIDGVPAVEVNLRGGWSIGKVQNIYIVSSPGGDQILGRVLSGADIHSREFSVLPPHFTRAALDWLLDYGWNKIVPGYSFYPPGFQRVIPFLLASIVFHEPYIRKWFETGHQLFTMKLFSIKKSSTQSLLSYLKENVTTGIGSDGDLHATGIPTNLILANRICSLEDKQIDIVAKLEEVYQRTHSKIDELPLLTSTQIRNDHDFVGVQPITRGELVNLFGNFQTEMSKQIQEISYRGNDSAASVRESVQHRDRNHAQPQYFSWGGKFNLFPYPNFIFPTGDTVGAAWSRWHLGIAFETCHTHPLRNLIDKVHKQELPQCSNQLNAYIDVMLEMEKIGAELGIMRENELLTDPERITETYTQIYENLVKRIYVNRKEKCPGDTTYITIARVLRTWRKNNGQEGIFNNKRVKL